MKTCSVCRVEKQLDEFWPDRRRKNGLMARCKECNKAQAIIYRASKTDFYKIEYKKYKTKIRNRHLKNKYGIGIDNYSAILEAQGGCCAICGKLESEQFKGVLHVDHDHATGAVRGLLCRGCNHMLGVVGDDTAILERAINYLKSHKAIVPQQAAQMIRMLAQP